MSPDISLAHRETIQCGEPSPDPLTALSRLFGTQSSDSRETGFGKTALLLRRSQQVPGKDRMGRVRRIWKILIPNLTTTAA